MWNLRRETFAITKCFPYPWKLRISTELANWPFLSLSRSLPPSLCLSLEFREKKAAVVLAGLLFRNLLRSLTREMRSRISALETYPATCLFRRPPRRNAITLDSLTGVFIPLQTPTNLYFRAFSVLFTSVEKSLIFHFLSIIYNQAHFVLVRISAFCNVWKVKKKTIWTPIIYLSRQVLILVNGTN